MTYIKNEIGKKFWTVENNIDGDVGENYLTKTEAVNMAKKMRADDKETGLDYIGIYSVLENIIVGKNGNAWIVDSKIIYQTQ